MSYYDDLGVSQHASAGEIRRAYLQIARKNHPDIKPNDADATAVFTAAAEAHKVLSDPEQRLVYDQQFRPITSLVDLFSRPAGQKMVAAMLPSGPSAPRDGLDMVITVQVSSDIVTEWGIVEIPYPNNPQQLLSFRVPAGYEWCRLTELGNPGQRGGANGDLYIHLLPTNA